MGPADYDQEELLMMLQDALTAVSAGRTEGHRCPVCDRGNLVCEADGEGWVKAACPQCGMDFEGFLS